MVRLMENRVREDTDEGGNKDLRIVAGEGNT